MHDPKHAPHLPHADRPPSPPSPPSRRFFGGRLRLPRVGSAVRPWLIALVWLMCAALFQAALAQTTDTPLEASADGSADTGAPSPSPSPSVTLVIPFSAGSGPDHVARTMALVWRERSGERVLVRNLPDRQGYLAARQVAGAPPDGRMLLLTCSPLLERPARLADDPFQPPAASAEDFTPIARVGQLPFVTVFPPGMFGRWLTPLSTPPSLADVASALPASIAHPRFAAGAALADPPDRADFDALDTRDVPAWNALLAPPRLPGELAARLRTVWQQVVSDARVRLALAQSGTELWERIPQESSR